MEINDISDHLVVALLGFGYREDGSDILGFIETEDGETGNPCQYRHPRGSNWIFFGSSIWDIQIHQQEPIRLINIAAIIPLPMFVELKLLQRCLICQTFWD